jgi:hypothetical protein
MHRRSKAAQPVCTGCGKKSAAGELLSELRREKAKAKPA